MYRLPEEDRRAACEWIRDIEAGEWPRGRVRASKQLPILKRALEESNLSAFVKEAEELRDHMSVY